MSTRSTVWTKTSLKLLGTISDRKIAQALKISSKTVRRKREQLRIPAFRAKIQWTKRMLSLLGKTQDLEIARRFGITPSVVTRKRTKLGIQSVIRRRIIWTSSMLRDLVRLRLTEFSIKYDMSLGSAAMKRKSLNLRPHLWNTKSVSWLGKLSDASIARRLGIDRTTVLRKRRSLNIAPFQKRDLKWSPTRAKHPHSHKQVWTKRRIAWLGNLTDQEIAQRMNLNRSTVARMRIQLGILSSRSKKFLNKSR